MKLLTLKIKDFGIFGGEHIFDLHPDEESGKLRNIVLIGGLNGSGKTTFLDAIRLVLYGNRAQCSKRGPGSYETFARKSVHNRNQAKRQAELHLTFEYSLAGESAVYDVSRSWQFLDRGFREEVIVRKNNSVDGWLSENWHHVVDEFLPIGISRICFFDAEQVELFSEDVASTSALRAAIRSLLGLDLAERLVDDADTLAVRIAKRTGVLIEKSEIGEDERLQMENQSEIDRLVLIIGGLENRLGIARNNLAQVEAHFSQIGGRHWERSNEFQMEKERWKTYQEEAEENLLALAATEMPFALVRELLQKASVQATLEHRSLEERLIEAHVESQARDLKHYLEERDVPQALIDVVEQFFAQTRQEGEPVVPYSPRLNVTTNGNQLITHLLDQILPRIMITSHSAVKRLFESVRQIEKYETSLSTIPNDDILGNVVTQLKEASLEVDSCERELSQFEQQLKGLRFQREQIEKRLHSSNQKMVDIVIHSEQDQRVLALLSRTKITMKEYLDRITLRKLEALGGSISESFRFLLHKVSLIETVKIDQTSFQLLLYDVSGEQITRDRLSEGEKQILAISVLWGLLRSSGRNLPVIIDTPMARLDQNHRCYLLQRYFPNASHQVILLSTNTELDHRNLEEIQPFVSRTYLLNYDENVGATRIVKNCFQTLLDTIPGMEDAT